MKSVESEVGQLLLFSFSIHSAAYSHQLHLGNSHLKIISFQSGTVPLWSAYSLLYQVMHSQFHSPGGCAPGFLTVPLKHVLRLSGMGVLTLGLSFIAISNGLVKSVEAGRMLKNSWLEGLLPDNPSGLSADVDVFYTGFIGMFDHKPRLSLFLWTMEHRRPQPLSLSCASLCLAFTHRNTRFGSYQRGSLTFSARFHSHSMHSAVL